MVKQGDLIWIDLDPTKGSEQSGHRPAIVLSNSRYNQGGFVIVCPITSKKKSPFHYELPAGLGIEGFVIADQPRSVDIRARPFKVAGEAPVSVVQDVSVHVQNIIKI